LLPWQENVFEASMGERAGGLWAAKHVGLSCPRQNGKGSVLEARALAGLLLFNEQMIIHSAHEVRTAQLGFRRLKSYFENFDDLSRKVAAVGNAVAREYIRLRSGQEIRFVTRSKSAIRGFSADCLLLDEGQILDDLQWEAILYTVSARPTHQIWLVGTPPLSIEEGIVFNRFRQRGIDGKDHQLAWLEWSADPGADLDDPVQWSKANPALGTLISHATVTTERAAASNEGFGRERLGIWPADLRQTNLDVASWLGLETSGAAAPDRVAVAVDVSPYRNGATIAVAGRGPGGRTLVMVFCGEGTAWVAEKVKALDASLTVVEISLTSGEARGLAGDLASAGLEFKQLAGTDVAASCTAFQAGIAEGTVAHVGQRELDGAVAKGRTRRMGDAETWDRDFDTDISPLVAAAAAYHRWMVLADVPYNVLESVL
jgi:phage terminase large subunit-like protein